MIEVYLVYEDINDKKRLEEADNLPPFFVTYYDMLTKEGKSKGYKLKSEFGARLNPFVVMYIDGSPVKAFYSEDSDDIINDLIKELNDRETNSIHN